ncbi:MAG: flagellin N-terminal helical domain-containing protein [Planctomycetota bacterium]
MARINTNVLSLIAQNTLTRTNADLATRLERLSTGLRINRGADDPAGLIVSERLRAEARSIDRAISNSERASSVIATTEGYLAEVSDLLTSMKALVVESANTGGLSQEEIEANQLQIDSAIDSINRIANTASFAGLQLLNGSMEYITSGLPTSAVAAAEIFSVQFGNSSTRTVAVEVVASAQTASLFLSGNTTGSVGALLSTVTIELAGNEGVQALSFASGTALSAVVAAVNTVRDATGVSATLVSATDQSSGLVFSSLDYGDDAFVSVRRIGAGGTFFETFEQQNGTRRERDTGRDVSAIVNGSLATANGLGIALNTESLGLEMLLTAPFAQTIGVSRSFEITGGGTTFQLGPDISASHRIGFGVRSITPTRVGGTTMQGVRYFLNSLKTGGANAVVDGRSKEALQVLDSAIDDISTLRGQLGAFDRNRIETNVRSLQIGLENITSSESRIRDADFAAETSKLTRAQILTQAGTSVLATANATAQSVLALLG